MQANHPPDFRRGVRVVPKERLCREHPLVVRVDCVDIDFRRQMQAHGPAGPG